MKTPRAWFPPCPLWAAFALCAAGQVGCAPPSGECADFADCDPGQICSKDGACVAAPVVNPPVNNGDGGPIGDGGGGGDGGPNDGGPEVTEERVTTEGRVLSLQRDPRPGRAGMLLVAERDGAFDRVSALDGTTAQIGDAVFDFEEISPAEPCGVDSVRLEAEPNLTAATIDELWFACTEGDPWRIRYTDDPTDPGVDETIAAPDLVARFPADSQDRQHALVAARGDTALYSVVFPESALAREEHRPISTVGTTFGAIVQIHALTPAADATAQDYAAVFDRGIAAGGERLIALQRDDTDDAWAVNTALGTAGIRTLHPGTTAVAIIGDIDTNGLEQPATPNLVELVPAEGRAYYSAYENPDLFDDYVEYEPTATFRGEVPAPEGKILLDAVPGAGLFFATTTAWHAWRIPFDPIDDGDVLTVEFIDASDVPNGMVAFDATHAWFSFPTDDEQVRRLELRP